MFYCRTSSTSISYQVNRTRVALLPYRRCITGVQLPTGRTSASSGRDPNCARLLSVPSRGYRGTSTRIQIEIQLVLMTCPSKDDTICIIQTIRAIHSLVVATASAFQPHGYLRAARLAVLTCRYSGLIARLARRLTVSHNA